MTFMDCEIREKTEKTGVPFWLLPCSFFALEVFGFVFLRDETQAFALHQLWPLAFGLLWSLGLSGIVRLFPWKAGRVLYGLFYLLSLSYGVGQTGYYFMFSEMMWVTDFLYASEGSDYFSVIFSFPLAWWVSFLCLLAAGILIVFHFPRWHRGGVRKLTAGLLAACSLSGAFFLPQVVFLRDSSIRYARSDYGRSQSSQAAYENMFNAHRLYEVCGLYQTAVKDIWANVIYPVTPAHALARSRGRQEIDSYFARRPQHPANSMTGRFAGKNVVLVLMESMDDWLIGPHTPTISRLMEEGINFTHFYTPAYGGIRTFNTEFCTNNGMFLSSKGGHAFDYVNNDFSWSLPNTLKGLGYSPKVFHYNDPNFYSRGVYSLAMGYDEYVCYADYVEDEDQLYDDKILFDNPAINDIFFREGAPTLNFIITRSAHLSYKYNEILSHWGLKRYPEYRGLTGNEETDCAYLKARLVDDMFTRLLEELEAHGQLENTVIIALTDHYTYGYKDMASLYALSGVEDPLLLEKTPFFIWEKDLEPLEVTKTANTSDVLPTVLNLLGITPEVPYIGRDIFDDSYPGYAPFSDGSWISGKLGYNAKEKELLKLEPGAVGDQKILDSLTSAVAEFGKINNLILDTDYYQSR